MYTNSSRGFSLIELLVVIAIVALISAIALPSYTEYTQRTKLGTIWSTVDAIKSRALEYYSTTGSWATSAASLGYTTPVGDEFEIEDAHLFNSNLTNIEILDNGGSPAGTCTDGNVQTIVVYADPSLGLGANYVGLIFLGETDEGLFVEYCFDSTDAGATFGNTAIGETCEYNFATGAQFLAATCQ